MKGLLGFGIALVALTTGSAMAADMSTKMPLKAPPMPVYNWTGCYINGGVGYGLFDQEHTSINIPGNGAAISGTVNTAGEGWLGRFGGGCDYQISSSFVIGVLGDYDWTHIHGTFQNPFSGAGGDENESSEWFIGGRIGYLVTPNLLTYFSGGYTEANFDRTNLGFLQISPPGAPFAYFDATTYKGWFLGGGVEYALSGILPFNGLFWRTEY